MVDLTYTDNMLSLLSLFDIIFLTVYFSRDTAKVTCLFTNLRDV